MPKVSPQDARRNFLIKQYKERGVDGMAQKDVLELFLSFLTTKSRSPILTKDVLDRFGNISEFLHATRDELLSVEGLDSNARLLMTLLPFVHCRAAEMSSKDERLDTKTAACAFFRRMLSGLSEERMAAVCLTTDFRIKNCRIISFGEVDTVRFKEEDILTFAIESKSKTTIIAHNHVLTTSMPSDEDLSSTERLQGCLAQRGILLLDHIIVGRDGARSLINYDGYRTNREVKKRGGGKKGERK